jgi:hypothetical protein
VDRADHRPFLSDPAPPKLAILARDSVHHHLWRHVGHSSGVCAPRLRRYACPLVSPSKERNDTGFDISRLSPVSQSVRCHGDMWHELAQALPPRYHLLKYLVLHLLLHEMLC